MITWLINWWINLLITWFITWLIYWLIAWSIDIDWLANWLITWLSTLLINWLIESLLGFVQLGKTKHHKSHHFDVCNETSMMVGEAKPGIGGEPLPFQKAKPRTSKFPKGEGSNLPAWVAFDRQVRVHYKDGVRLRALSKQRFVFDSLQESQFVARKSMQHGSCLYG